MKIFENKKLFGKLNIIDLVIIILLFVIAVFGYILLKGGNTSLVNSNQKEYVFTIQIQKANKNILSKIDIGDKIYDNENNKYIGEVIEKEEKEYKEVTNNYEKNTYEYATNDKYINIDIKLKSNLQDKGSSLTTSDDYKIKVGKNIYVRGNDYAGSGYIIDIER